MLFLLGCAATELSQDWQVDRLRVLAVAATPAEPVPGDVVTFSALIVSPAVPLAGSAWFACSAESSSDYGCQVDPALLEGGDTGSLDPEALAEAGMIGFLPYLPPTWVVPTDFLDHLEEPDRLEGTFGMVYIVAFPEQEEVSEADVEVAYKRVPVSLASTPNHNPAVTGFAVGGYAVPAGGHVRLSPGEAYALDYTLADDAVETYTYRNSAGTDESRTEEPYASWYLQEGSFDQADVLWPHTRTTLHTPSEPSLTTQTVWVVVRDRRGGMGWASFSVSYAD